MAKVLQAMGHLKNIVFLNKETLFEEKNVEIRKPLAESDQQCANYFLKFPNFEFQNMGSTTSDNLSIV